MHSPKARVHGGSKKDPHVPRTEGRRPCKTFWDWKDWSILKYIGTWYWSYRIYGNHVANLHDNILQYLADIWKWNFTYVKTYWNCNLWQAMARARDFLDLFRGWSCQAYPSLLGSLSQALLVFLSQWLTMVECSNVRFTGWSLSRFHVIHCYLLRWVLSALF